MNMRHLFPLLVFPLIFAHQAFSAEDDQQPDPKIQLWQAELNDTSKITIAVSQIVSIAMHPYLLNGENLVTEVTIDTTGNNTVRFYYVHPDDEKTDYTDPESVVKSARKRLSQRPSQPKAQENAAIASLKFPEGAYAHTIEYQVSSIETLDAIFKSITTVWEKVSKKRTVYKLSISE